MTVRNPKSRDRASDSSLPRFILPVLLSVFASVIGGTVSTLLTIQIAVYRLGVLEGHEKDDKERFVADDVRDHSQDIKLKEHDVRISSLEHLRIGGT